VLRDAGVWVGLIAAGGGSMSHGKDGGCPADEVAGTPLGAAEDVVVKGSWPKKELNWDFFNFLSNP